ncbi:mediator of RNA polymerase II transcription subunit 1-domain-containing protein [Diplogelasinospora grovesii]|uniref:Mediator of RNA polymerase II transcription subunit 1 n=1 Tax=Diplogelasinospora grovesii TaxID=303347 RepID=A0AAN6S6X2_9PEZI|nr:mediator of RNA polymerase II transcription subunit 1-domain-containing protein [Diplogelasinospora grovesii]
MSTPTPMKHAPSQQGRTPSQSQHGAAATPPVSTPFSAAHAAFSPLGPRSSPQQVKKSPATMMGPPSNAPINFDSPNTAAAFGALQMGAGLDLMGSLGSLGKSTEDTMSTRVDNVFGFLGRGKGAVSEAAVERLAKEIGLECLWEDGMGVESTRTLIVAGSALELLITFSKDVVQSVQLAFPESAEIVNKHSEAAGKILFDDLKLASNQGQFIKEIDRFAENFERLAILDKLSINPGLNLYEAVAGIYESLVRLHQWELQKVRQDPANDGRREEYLHNLVLCTKSGNPVMNARDRIGLCLDYWKEKRLQVPSPQMSADAFKKREANSKLWGLLIGCSPLRDIGLPPVRISDKWIAADIEKVALPGDLHTGTAIDWLEPEDTFLPSPDPAKPGSEAVSLLGPRLPEVAFTATLDPPVHISYSLWENIRQTGCGLHPNENQFTNFEDLVLPGHPPRSNLDPTESRALRCRRQVPVMLPDKTMSTNTHNHNLYIPKMIFGQTLSEISFSHPQQLVSVLPYLRQYAFLSTLLETSFKAKPAERKDKPSTATTMTVRTVTTTTRDDFGVFMNGARDKKADTVTSGTDEDEGEEPGVRVDVTLTIQPVPQLDVVFPFRGKNNGHVTLEIRENGHVHVESQNILDERNSVSPTTGRQRRPEDIGKVLELMEDIGQWVEVLRTKWI